MGILKTISTSKLHTSRKEKSSSVGVETTDRFSFNANQRLVVNVCEGYKIIAFNTIMSLKSDSNYTTIYLTNGNSILVSKTMKQIENQLDHNFLRVHNSYVVNLHHVKQFNKRNSEITLEDDSIISVARRRKPIVESYFIES